MDTAQLSKIAAGQAGLFTRTQARACGFSARQVRHRVRAESWRQVFGPVLAVAGIPVTPTLRDRAAQFAIPGARSPAERLLVGILRRAGISGWVANHQITDASGPIGDGDIVFPALRLVLELDGWAYHITPDRFRSDRERQNRLVAAGWTVLRFTWHDVTSRPDYVIAAVNAMISRLSA
jgi:very-short-patch-repair endonuclease